MSEWAKDNPLREEAERIRSVSKPNLSDWADEKAREWLSGLREWEGHELEVGNLAALLREVRASGALFVRAEILREQESKL